MPRNRISLSPAVGLGPATGTYSLSDTFGGVGAPAWLGATWTVLGGSVSNAPTQGAELIVNGAMAASTPSI